MSRQNFAILFAAVMISALCYGRGEQNPFARLVGLGYQEIDQHALEEPSDEELLSGAMRGMVEVLNKRGDEHSLYIDAAEAEPYLAEMRQEIGGIGIHLRMLGKPPTPTIVGPPEPETPAARAGLKAGDVILEINGQSVVGLAMEELLQRMRGPVGEPVVLLLRPAGVADPLPVTMVRETIELPSVLGDRRTPDGAWVFQLEQQPRIALVRITTFGAKTVDELSNILAEVRHQGAQALVLDLRENAGGSLEAAVDTCDFFLAAKKVIVETRGREAEVQDRYLSTGGEYQQWPLAVLVDRNSASASEIVAACLQDHRRAAIVGERSFGKGTVQRLVDIAAGKSVLKLTTASYWRPSGRNIHRHTGDPPTEKWGVTPDQSLEVKQTKAQLLQQVEGRLERDIPPPEGANSANYEDAVLERAVEHLGKQLSE